jgi:hypothetical protein
VGFTKWQDVVLDGSPNERVLRLNRIDAGDPLKPTHLADGKVGHADVAYFAFRLELGQCVPSFFDLVFWLGLMELVKIDCLEAQAAKACLALSADRCAAQAAGDPPASVPNARAFGEYEGSILSIEASERGPYDLLGVSESIRWCRIDPFDTACRRMLNCGYRSGIVLWSPFASTGGPCAETNASDLRTVATEAMTLLGLTGIGRMSHRSTGCTAAPVAAAPTCLARTGSSDRGGLVADNALGSLPAAV